MYFSTKNYLKNTRNHTTKQAFIDYYYYFCYCETRFPNSEICLRSYPKDISIPSQCKQKRNLVTRTTASDGATSFLSWGLHSFIFATSCPVPETHQLFNVFLSFSPSFWFSNHDIKNEY